MSGAGQWLVYGNLVAKSTVNVNQMYGYASALTQNRMYIGNGVNIIVSHLYNVNYYQQLRDTYIYQIGSLTIQSQFTTPTSGLRILQGNWHSFDLQRVSCINTNR